MKKNKIAIVITYFGKFPSYINYFLETCSFNNNIDFLVFKDNKEENILYSENIKFTQISMDEFNKLATNKLNMKIDIKGGYKLCDFKPMYGKIYEEQLAGYEFWGFCDVDMILGDLSKLLTDDFLTSHDVISAHSQYLSGPFSLFRNKNEVNTLFLKSKDISRIMQEDKIFLFDEASTVIHHLWEGKDIFLFESEVESMTHILMNKAKCNLRVVFAGFITERVHDKLKWEDGRLCDANGEELFVFHYIVYKNKVNFTVPSFEAKKRFYFDSKGFHTDRLRSKTLDRVTSLMKNFSFKFSRKLKKIM